MLPPHLPFTPRPRRSSAKPVGRALPLMQVGQWAESVVGRLSAREHARRSTPERLRVLSGPRAIARKEG